MDKFDSFKEIYFSKDGKIKKTEIAKELGVSRQMVYNYIFKIKNGSFKKNNNSKGNRAILVKIYEETLSISKKLDKINL